jgi:hypothetical protein
MAVFVSLIQAVDQARIYNFIINAYVTGKRPSLPIV